MSKKILVAYFSASGVTAKLAGRLAGVIGADLFEIKPEVTYGRFCHTALLLRDECAA